jgi:hypothetical protein
MTLSLLFQGCAEKGPLKREANFDVIISLSDGSKRIKIKDKQFSDGIGSDVRDAIFTLNSIEIEKIFNSVPWEEVSKLPDYYNPKCSESPIPSSTDEITIVNGSLEKKIIIQQCIDYQKHEDAERIKGLDVTLSTITNIVFEKKDVKKVYRLQMTL